MSNVVVNGPQLQTQAPGGTEDPSARPALCLLSLDGGGVRGLSTLLILHRLMESINHERQRNGKTVVKPCQLFDLIGGTSTGGLIAILLGRLEMTTSECIDAYLHLMGGIFEKKQHRFAINSRAKLQNRFSQDKLRDAILEILKRKNIPADEMLDNGVSRRCRMFVCAARTENGNVVCLRSYTPPGEYNADTPTIVEAALATSAATTFFPPVAIGQRTYVDAALSANNPVNIVWNQAQDLWSREEGSLSVKCFLSIGTGHRGESPIGDSLITFAKTLKTIATETERTAQAANATYRGLLNQKKYFRFNVQHGLETVGLEECEKRGLIEAATIDYLNEQTEKFRVRDVAVSLEKDQDMDAVSTDVPDTATQVPADHLFTTVDSHGVIQTTTSPSTTSLLVDQMLSAPTMEDITLAGMNSNIHLQDFTAHVNSVRVSDNQRIEHSDHEKTRNTRANLVYDAPDLLSPHFKGRSQELKDIELALIAIKVDTPRRCVIFGMPGLGKTQLALAYAKEAASKGRRYIFWISSDTREKVESGIATISDRMKLELQRNLEQREKIIVSQTWLEETSGWLLIFDNVTDETTAAVRDILPKRNTDGQVLMTTRLRHVASVLSVSMGISHPCIKLELLPAELSVAILRESSQSSKESSEDDEFSQLARKVGYLPLALIQAASYMKESRCSVEELLEIYESAEVDEILDELNVPEYERHPLQTTVHLALDELRRSSPEALSLLRLVSFLDPENIPLKILAEGTDGPIYIGGSPNPTDAPIPIGPAELAADDNLRELNDLLTLLRSKVKLVRAVQHLQRLSLVMLHDSQSISGQGQSIWMHGLVHMIVRRKLLNTSNEKIWLERGINVFENVQKIKTVNDLQKLGSFIALEPHIKCLDSHSLRLNGSGLRMLFLNFMLGLCFHCYGRNEDFERVLRMVFNTAEGLYGTTAPVTISFASHLGKALYTQGKYAEANEFLQRTLKSSMITLGKRHPTTVSLLASLPVVSMRLGRINEAEIISRRVFKYTKNAEGHRSEATLGACYDLTVILLHQAKFEEAERLGRWQLELALAKEGSSPHVLVVRSQFCLAEVLFAQGKKDEAGELCKQAREASRNALGPDHPMTIACLDMWGTVLKANGKDEASEEAHRQAYHLKQAILGPKHPDTLQTAFTWACALMDLKRYEAAEEVLRQVIQKREQIFDADHLEISLSYYYLGLLLAEKGEMLEAEECWKRMCSINARGTPKNLSVAIRSFLKLGDLYWTQKRLSESEDMYRQALNRIRKRSEELPEKLFEILLRLTRLLADQERLQEARDLIPQLLKAMKPLSEVSELAMEEIGKLAAQLGEEEMYDEAEKLFLLLEERCAGVYEMDHHLIYANTMTFSALLERTERSEEAETRLWELFEHREQRMDESHPSNLFLLHILSGMLDRLKRFSESEVILRHLWHRHRHRLLPDRQYEEMAVIAREQAAVLDELDRTTEAERFLRQALPEIEAGLGEEHEKTLALRNSLVAAVGKQGRLQEAENMAREVMQEFKRVHGDDSPGTLHSMKNMLVVLKYQGKQMEMLKLLNGAPPALFSRYPEYKGLYQELQFRAVISSFRLVSFGVSPARSSGN